MGREELHRAGIPGTSTAGWLHPLGWKEGQDGQERELQRWGMVVADRPANAPVHSSILQTLGSQTTEGRAQYLAE